MFIYDIFYNNTASVIEYIYDKDERGRMIPINKNITAANALGRIGALAKAARLECGCAHGGGEHKAALHGRKQRKRRGAIGNEYMLRCVEINIVLAGNAQL